MALVFVRRLCPSVTPVQPAAPPARNGNLCLAVFGELLRTVAVFCWPPCHASCLSGSPAQPLSVPARCTAGICCPPCSLLLEHLLLRLTPPRPASCGDISADLQSTRGSSFAAVCAVRGGVSDPGYMSRKLRKFRTDKIDTLNKQMFCFM